ncbi:hypothetical protein [Streptomyces cavernicola]|uniref:SsgA family sporulation/cell division regulator n=1 Tax=Streptomyces cavernicola TaxID=3043613 RepID=A0ABT6SJG2_9ACTN|nr:hypothetical protein [Streptomyces sp. B-S-A6]MDI3408331.1 hypothetical protein [Streptomyces sp. B-S-A6]
MSTTAAELSPTIHVDVPLNLPTSDGTLVRTRQAIGAIRTQTEGLVIFPKVVGLMEIDESVWVVTHTLTGLRLPFEFPDEEHATAFANAAAPMACWDQEQPVVTREAKLQLVALAEEHAGFAEPRFLADLDRRSAT